MTGNETRRCARATKSVIVRESFPQSDDVDRAAEEAVALQGLHGLDHLVDRVEEDALLRVARHDREVDVRARRRVVVVARREALRVLRVVGRVTDPVVYRSHGSVTATYTSINWKLSSTMITYRCMDTHMSSTIAT